jgi:hypothetical protein
MPLIEYNILSRPFLIFINLSCFNFLIQITVWQIVLLIRSFAFVFISFPWDRFADAKLLDQRLIVENAFQRDCINFQNRQILGVREWISLEESLFCLLGLKFPSVR